jgi:hypothetical protein
MISGFNGEKNSNRYGKYELNTIYLKNFSHYFIYLILLFSSSFSPLLHAQSALNQQANVNNLKIYINNIVHGSNTHRNYRNIVELNRVAAWLKGQMQQFGITCHYQDYIVDQQSYKNVICPLNVGATDKYIVGAHYDVYGEQDGADDNASGVAGVLETARLLQQNKANLKHNIDFVFYTLEEPPYFRTEQMGSYVHAKSIRDQTPQILGVYILEMIGYYSSQDIQTYPTGLGLFYPKHGNFIAAISNWNSRGLSTNFCEKMSKLEQLQCERLIAPAFIHGVDFSDHGNYWKFNIPAIMITDTAFFRNAHYHLATDTIEQLNFQKMANVVDGVVETLLNTAK